MAFMFQLDTTNTQGDRNMPVRGFFKTVPCHSDVYNHPYHILMIAVGCRPLYLSENPIPTVLQPVLFGHVPITAAGSGYSQNAEHAPRKPSVPAGPADVAVQLRCRPTISPMVA
jgi:hypothetical protein